MHLHALFSIICYCLDAKTKSRGSAVDVEINDEGLCFVTLCC